MRPEAVAAYACYLPVLFSVISYFWLLLTPKYSFRRSLLTLGPYYALSLAFLFFAAGRWQFSASVSGAATLYMILSASLSLPIWKSVSNSKWSRILYFFGAMAVIMVIGATLSRIISASVLADAADKLRCPRVQAGLTAFMCMLIQSAFLLLFSWIGGRYLSKHRAEFSWTSFAFGLLAEGASLWMLIYYIITYDAPHFHVFVLILLLFIASDVYLSRTFRQIVKSHELEQEILLLDQMQALQHRQYTQMGDQLESMRRVRHDYANTLSTIARLIDAGDYAGARTLIDESAAPLGKPVFYTGNSIVDAVLYAKSLEAEKLHVDLSVSLLLPEPLRMNDRDIMSVFANLLDNALEYCAALDAACERRVAVSSAMQGSLLKLTVSNTYLLPEPPSVQNPVSTKRDGREHGHGLSIVRSIAEAYHGTLSADVSGGMLHMKALLNLPEGGEGERR